MAEDDRLGLALSGGGFRASFFHLGVLARLADWGVLPRVELISTVSGGSVIGALYYLHVKNLLEQKADEDITAADYVAIVQQMEREFLAAVQRNVRMHIFASPLKNLRMAMGNYSRSDRIGELYDEFFYRPAAGSDGPVELRNLKIQPKGDRPDFHPLRHNYRRRARVPVLLINATTLNTGASWRFEASRMGEPPRDRPVLQEIDKSPRLGQPPGYGDLPEHQRDFGLGLAVSASTAVPGVFHPLSVTGLYPDVQVQLVDGGVHDNQGVQALLDRGCTHFIVSDASVQMGFEPHPSTGILTVVARTNAIFMSRIRGEQLVRVLESEGHPTALLHLRKGLPRRTIYPQGLEPDEGSEEAGEAGPEVFGVDQEVQQRLARVRTDLDAFTDVEAYSLMMDAYLMSEYEFSQTPFLKALRTEGEDPAEAAAAPGPPAATPSGSGDGDGTGRQPRWRFEAVGSLMANPTPEYLRQLDIAADAALKAFRLNPSLTAGAAVVLLALAAAAGLVWHEDLASLMDVSLRLGDVLAVAALAVVGMLPGTGRWLSRVQALRSPLRFVKRLLTRALPALALAPFAWLYVVLAEPLFLRHGRVERLKQEEA